MKVKEESEKVGLNLNIQKMKIMAAVTICSDFGAPQIKSDTVSTVSPSICHEVMGPDAMILVFWMLSFKPIFFTLFFHFHQEAF